MQIGDFSILYIISFMLAIAFSIQLLFDNKTAQSSLAWIMAMFLIPYIGIGAYVLSGINWRKRKLVKFRPEEMYGTFLHDILVQQRELINEKKEYLGSDTHKIMMMTMQTANGVLMGNNDISVYHHGEPLFRDMIRDLEAAQESIHIEYFIYRDDEIGKEILSILKRKATEGVEVRFLVDGSGSKFTFTKRGRRKLRKSDVEYRNFLDPGNIIFAWLLNYSSHRKIVVIDNKISYTGGMNIGKEYIDGGKRFETWRDTHMRFVGNASVILQSIFLADWINSGGVVNNAERFFGKLHLNLKAVNLTGVQMLSSGPDSDWFAIQQLYFTMITNANNKVVIQSPYFIPDESIATALENAALSGVEVNLMITGCPDKRVPFWAAHSFFEPLLKAGVKIFLYKAGFLHSKVVIIDEKIVTCGSCNMDQRSFFLDYELNAIFYNNKIAQEFSSQFKKDCEYSEQFTLEMYHNITAVKKLRNSVFRLISPLL